MDRVPTASGLKQSLLSPKRSPSPARQMGTPPPQEPATATAGNRPPSPPKIPSATPSIPQMDQLSSGRRLPPPSAELKRTVDQRLGTVQTRTNIPADPFRDQYDHLIPQYNTIFAKIDQHCHGFHPCDTNYTRWLARLCTLLVGGVASFKTGTDIVFHLGGEALHLATRCCGGVLPPFNQRWMDRASLSGAETPGNQKRISTYKALVAGKNMGVRIGMPAMDLGVNAFRAWAPQAKNTFVYWVATPGAYVIAPAIGMGIYGTKLRNMPMTNDRFRRWQELVGRLPLLPGRTPELPPPSIEETYRKGPNWIAKMLFRPCCGCRRATPHPTPPISNQESIFGLLGDMVEAIKYQPEGELPTASGQLDSSLFFNKIHVVDDIAKIALYSTGPIVAAAAGALAQIVEAKRNDAVRARALDWLEQFLTTQQNNLLGWYTVILLRDLGYPVPETSFTQFAAQNAMHIISTAKDIYSIYRGLNNIISFFSKT